MAASSFSSSGGLSGLSATTNYSSITFSTNSASSTTANNSNTITPASGTMYTYTTGGPVSLAWTPSANLNDATIANPLASNLPEGTINFIVTATDLATGCVNKDTVVVTVNPIPAATFTGLAATYCSSDAAATLTGTPSNGTFSGPGMSGNVFTPSSAGVGTHTITYSVTDISSGCSNTTSQSVTVTQPTVTFTGLDATYCNSSAAATLTGNQAPGGTFSGTGITDNADGTATFNPATAGAGTHTITYSFTDGGGCFNSSTQTTTVTNASSATIAYAGSPYCSNGGTVSVTHTGTTGGVYSSTTGLSINASTGEVNIAASTAGTYEVTYTVAANGPCPSVTATTSITIDESPAAEIVYANSPYCSTVTSAPVTLLGTSGGTYSSTSGLDINAATGEVNPSASTPGTYTVTYTIAASGGCAAYITTTGILITAQPAATIAYTANPYCTTGGTATVTHTGTTGGTYSSTAGLDINASTGDVTLASSTAGTYTVTYFRQDRIPLWGYGSFIIQ